MKETILSLLPPDFPWGESVHYFAVTDSTNTQAKELARAGAPHGTLVIAGGQTGGKGRLGRQFHSPAGQGVYLSMILRPGCPAADLMHLTCAAGVAMCEAVEAVCGITPGIKWPNDLIWKTKKIGGILTEIAFDRNAVTEYVILGVGINCSQTPGDFPTELQSIAASLSQAANKPVLPEALAAAMSTALWRMDSRLFAGKAALMEAYRRYCVTLEKDVLLVQGEERIPARALDIDPDGGLIVRLTDGSTRTVSTGEVSVRGLYGYL